MTTNPTADDVLAKRACDLCGVTPYSEFRIHGEQIALVAIREARTNPPPVAEVETDDEGPCTDCDDTGITIQTERPCTCDAAAPTLPPSDDFTLAAEEAYEAGPFRTYKPFKGVIIKALIELARRGAEIERKRNVANICSAFGIPLLTPDA